jgi:hypothetical protein
VGEERHQSAAGRETRSQAGSRVAQQRPSEAKGTLTWTCTACAVGDGKAKLTIASNPLLAEGLGLPKIRLGDFSGKVAIDKGVGRLQNVQLKSQDLEVSVEGEIHLAQPIAASHVDLYVRFKLSDSLLRSSEKLRTIMDFTAQMGKRPDGFIGFRATGTFQNMSNVQWLKTSPFVSTTAPAKPAPPVSLRPRHPPTHPATTALRADMGITRFRFVGVVVLSCSDRAIARRYPSRHLAGTSHCHSLFAQPKPCRT